MSVCVLVTCECERIAVERDARDARWRALCEQFYFHQDGSAKRILDYFESSKLDQIMYECLCLYACESTVLAERRVTADCRACGVDAFVLLLGNSIEADMTAGETTDERAFTELITSLGLRKCVQREDHAHFFHETIEALERVKDEVRKSYHAHRSKSQYDEFDGHVCGMQSTNYEVKQDPDGQHRLAVRVQEGYLRTHSNQSHMEKSTEVFIKANVSNIGVHPFLAGLAEVLRWNLESTIVVGWRLTVKSRVWFLDPYLSDNDIRQLLRAFPPSRKLEGRPTGSKHNSELYRMNIHGKHDEHQRFFERWCVML
ncbi:hypothetical protein FI667_g6575, partial [Globisporangium splendens]